MKKPSDTLPDSKQVFGSINQRIKKNSGYQIISSVGDFENVENTLRLSSDAKRRILDEYRAALVQEKESLEQRISHILHELKSLEEKRSTIRQYSKDEKKGIHTTFRDAERDWKSVEGNRNNPDYTRFSHAYQLAHAEFRDMNTFCSTRSMFDVHEEALRTKLQYLQEERDGYGIEDLCESLRCELDEISIPVVKMDDVGANPESSRETSKTGKKIGLLVAGVLALGLSTAALLDKKNTKNGANGGENTSNTLRISQEAMANMLLEKDQESILGCLAQLEKHGSISQFNEEVSKALRDNYATITHQSDSHGTFLYGVNKTFTDEYLTYTTGINGQKVEVGVTFRDVGLAISRYLTQRLIELGVRDSLREHIQTIQLSTRSTVSPFGGNTVDIQAQNASLILEGMITNSLSDIAKEMEKNGYPMKGGGISKEPGKNNILEISYTLSQGNNCTLQFAF